jgi:hypothetical protein
VVDRYFGETTNKPAVKTINADAIPPDGLDVVKGNEPATVPNTTNKPAVKTIDADAFPPYGSVVV